MVSTPVAMASERAVGWSSPGRIDRGPSGLERGEAIQDPVGKSSRVGEAAAAPIDAHGLADTRMRRESPTQQDRDPWRFPSGGRHGHGRDLRTARVGCRDRYESRLVAGKEPGEILGWDVGAQVGHGPASLAQHLVQAHQPDHVVLPGDAGQDRERTDAALGPQVRPDAVEGSQQGLAGEVLLGDAPLPGSPALPDEAHRVREQPVEDIRPGRVDQGLGQGPGREFVVAIGEQAREEFRTHRLGGEAVRGGGVDRWEERGWRVVGHRTRLYHRRPGTDDYHSVMYLDAMEFLEEERDSWAPFEALAELDDATLARPVAAAHGWSGRDLMVHMIGWQGIALAIATELAVNETSPTIARIDIEWETLGGDAVNEALQRSWEDRPMDELRALFRTQPGELRGYLTVVPETRWLKHAEHLRTLNEETIAHYEEHRADLAAILAAAASDRAT